MLLKLTFIHACSVLRRKNIKTANSRYQNQRFHDLIREYLRKVPKQTHADSILLAHALTLSTGKEEILKLPSPSVQINDFTAFIGNI